ncbi:MAG: heme-binding protein [Isosphaera sp.]|nr:heme-binding protein [Isosphaera sp.]
MRTASLALLAFGLASAADDAPKPPAVDWAKAPNPAWVWGADTTKDYVLTKAFTPAGKVTAARVRVTCDNVFELHLNGTKVAGSAEWQSPVEVDVTKEVKAGENTLAATVRNQGGQAGFVLALAVVTDTGTEYVVSDGTWAAGAAKAKVVGKYGDAPWGKVFDGAAAQPKGKGKAPGEFKTLPGFKVEKLFAVPKDTLGSWVCLTADDKGRLIASDQGDKGLVRITPGKVGTDEPTKVEKIPAKITAAQGLLWHNGVLYVVCNGGPGSGLYRVTSSKKDDILDTVEKLKAINGGGEHGPHAVRLGPDGKSLYVVAGNFTKVPDGATSRVPPRQGEDHLLPRMWDAQGHARGILAPGGWVAKTDLDGKAWEVFSSGYRNAYDFAFNADGEMFVYDSDMEWDLGMPWYRPTRVTHTVSGGDYGWRSGSGVWPSHYPDSLPAMIDIGPGSPVGVEFGYGAKFPAKYQKALFICDWTFGTMYAVHTEPSGATYKATKEEFLSRTPLPLTDAVINPADGAMYFTIGGRGAQSELYRVTYTGKEPTDKAEYGDGRDADNRKARRRLEALHGATKDPGTAVFDHLGHEDRFVRYAARVALEHQLAGGLTGLPLSTRFDQAVGAALARVRQGGKGDGRLALHNLDTFDQAKLDERQQLDLLRAYQLVFTRGGEPDKATAAKLVAKLDPLFPDKSDAVNRELVQLLVYLKSSTVVAKTTKLLAEPSKPLTQAELAEVLARNAGYGGTIANMLKNTPDPQKLWYAFVLRNVADGWTLDQRKAYFGFLAEARTKSGGASYQGFLRNIENEAFANATDADRLAIEAAGLRKPFKPKELPKPLGPGREWTTADVVALEPKLQRGRDFKAGERAFAAARCVVCHRVGGDGGATGPDLTQVAGRFGVKDLAEALVEPSKVVSDQYKASVVRTVDEKSYVGKIVNDAGGKYTIVIDPEDSTKVVEVKKDDVSEVKPSNVSLMPEKLLNQLNEAEVLDMLAYMLSRGDPAHPMFKK